MSRLIFDDLLQMKRLFVFLSNIYTILRELVNYTNYTKNLIELKLINLWNKKRNA